MILRWHSILVQNQYVCFPGLWSHKFQNLLCRRLKAESGTKSVLNLIHHGYISSSRSPDTWISNTSNLLLNQFSIYITYLSSFMLNISQKSCRVVHTLKDKGPMWHPSQEWTHFEWSLMYTCHCSLAKDYSAAVNNTQYNFLSAVTISRNWKKSNLSLLSI